MEESILKSTKKKLGVDPDDASFDTDLIDYINTAFSHLQNLGVGPTGGFMIQDDTAKWNDFIPDAPLPVINQVKTNIELRVKGFFDPSQIQSVLASRERLLMESDVRLNNMREETEWVNPDPGFMVVDGGDPSGEP